MTNSTTKNVMNPNVDDPDIDTSRDEGPKFDTNSNKSPNEGGLINKGSVMLSDVFNVASDIATVNDNLIEGNADGNFMEGNADGDTLMADMYNNMKQFEHISYEIATKMIDILMAESQSELFFSNQLKQVEFLQAIWPYNGFYRCED